MSSRVAPTVVGTAPGADDGLLLPRPPGVFRRFWARHPRVADVIVAVFAFLLSAPAATYRTSFSVPPTPAQTSLAVALVTLACAALMLRRRHPLAVYALSILPLVVLPPGLAPAAHALPAFAIYAVAVYRSVRACWIAFGVACVLIGCVTVLGGIAMPSSLESLLTSLVSSVIALLLGSLIGINVGNRRRYLAALIDRSRQLLVERDQQAQLAAAAERTRIAREMHDIVSHSLTVIVALSEGAAAATTPARSRQASLSAADTARGALDEMRAMLGVLRDVSEDASPLAPIEPVDPADVVAGAQRAGFPVVSEITGSVADLPRSLRFALGRIVQEAVTNAMRHAPRARTIRVWATTTTDAVTVVVDNDGVRTAPAAPAAGFGLRGLRERIEHVGGALEAGPVGEGSWRVRATLPLTPPTAGSTA